MPYQFNLKIISLENASAISYSICCSLSPARFFTHKLVGFTKLGRNTATKGKKYKTTMRLQKREHGEKKAVTTRPRQDIGTSRQGQDSHISARDTHHSKQHTYIVFLREFQPHKKSEVEVSSVIITNELKKKK